MKTLYTAIDLRRTVRFQKTTRYLLETNAQVSAVSLLGTRSAYSTLTISLRCIALLLKKLTTGKQTGSDIINDVLKVGRAIGIVAEALTDWTITARTKIQEGMVSREAAAQSVKELIAKTGELELEDRELFDLLMFAVPGAGPSRTEREALIIAMTLTRLAADYANSDDTGPMAAAARLTYANLLAWQRHALAERPTSPQTLVSGVQEAMLKQRIETLRTMAGYMIGAAVSGTTQVTRHYLSWLKDPWVKSASFADVAERLDRAVEIFEQRTPAAGPYSQLPSLSAGDTYDLEVIQLPTLEKYFAVRPTVALALSTSPHQRALGGDLQYGLRFAQEGLTSWINSAWVLIRHAQETATWFQALALDTISTITVEDRTPALRTETGIVGLETLPAYPLVSKADPNYYWPTTVWALRAAGIEPHTQYTREQLRKLMEKYPEIPVRVTGVSTEIPLDIKPVLHPSFDKFDGMGLFAEKSLESIAMFWDTTPSRLKMLLATFGDQPGTLSWRSVAEALRFIGKLYVNDTAVEPYSRHWYHGRDLGDDCFEPNEASIELINTRVDKNGVQAVLRPFAFVPQSARMKQVTKDLVVTKTEVDNTNLPILQWVSDSSRVEASQVRIRGWIVGDSLLDIVLVPTVTTHLDGYITGMTDVGPFTTRPFNVIVDGTEAVDAAAPPTTAPPAGAFNYIDL